MAGDSLTEGSSPFVIEYGLVTPHGRLCCFWACSRRFELRGACWPLASGCVRWLVGLVLVYRLRIFLNYIFRRYISLCADRATGKQVHGAYPRNTIETTPSSRELKSLTGRAHGAVDHDAELVEKPKTPVSRNEESS